MVPKRERSLEVDRRNTVYAIEARGLAKAYGGRRVVNGFSMQVHKGDIYGFVG